MDHTTFNLNLSLAQLKERWRKQLDMAYATGIVAALFDVARGLGEAYNDGYRDYFRFIPSETVRETIYSFDRPLEVMGCPIIYYNQSVGAYSSNIYNPRMDKNGDFEIKEAAWVEIDGRVFARVWRSSDPKKTYPQHLNPASLWVPGNWEKVIWHYHEKAQERERREREKDEAVEAQALAQKLLLVRR